MMMKSGLEFFYFEVLLAPSDLLLPSAKKAAQKGWIGLAGYQVTLKGLVEFQNKKLDHFEQQKDNTIFETF